MMRADLSVLPVIKLIQANLMQAQQSDNIYYYKIKK